MPMTTQERDELCCGAFKDVVNYFATECPNMLTFYNMFRTNPATDVMTIRIDTQESCCPILDYNPNWIEKVYVQQSKFHFIYAVYVEMLRFILHHTTTRLCGPNTACASSVVTNIKESRSVFNFLPRRDREEVLTLLDTCPSAQWLQGLVAPMPLDKQSLTLEGVEAILNQVQYTDPGQTEEDYGGTYADGDSNFVMLPSNTTALEDYYSCRSCHECSAAWGENSTLDEQVRMTFENSDIAGWGTSMSAEQINNIRIANKRHANVGAILNRIRGHIISTDRELTRMRPNRRGLNAMGERHTDIGSVLVAIDVSGSMDKDDIDTGVSILDSFLSGAEVDYTFWDTKCMVPESLRGPIRVGADIARMVGGGGTQPECIGEMLKQEELHYDAVVVFTDTYWEWARRNIPANTQIVVISTVTDRVPRLPEFVNFHMNIEDLLSMKTRVM